MGQKTEKTHEEKCKVLSIVFVVILILTMFVCSDDWGKQKKTKLRWILKLFLSTLKTNEKYQKGVCVLFRVKHIRWKKKVVKSFLMSNFGVVLLKKSHMGTKKLTFVFIPIYKPNYVGNMQNSKLLKSKKLN